jgi:hypothetical protein
MNFKGTDLSNGPAQLDDDPAGGCGAADDDGKDVASKFGR